MLEYLISIIGVKGVSILGTVLLCGGEMILFVYLKCREK